MTPWTDKKNSLESRNKMSNKENNRIPTYVPSGSPRDISSHVWSVIRSRSTCIILRTKIGSRNSNVINFQLMLTSIMEEENIFSSNLWSIEDTTVIAGLALAPWPFQCPLSVFTQRHCSVGTWNFLREPGIITNHYCQSPYHYTRIKEARVHRR